MTSTQTIGVIGAGTMGSGIAQVCALAGFTDLIGLDALLAVMEVFHREFKDPKYWPRPLLKEMVTGGKLGRKSDCGFHTYT